MMTLYYAPGTCALAPIILSQWLDLPLALEQVDHKNPSKEYLAVNPLGAVPALRLDDGQVFTQVDAILQYFVAIRPDAGLGAGADLLDGFKVHQWVAFLTGDFHPPFGIWFNPGRFTEDHSEASLVAVREATAARITRVADVLNRQVGDSGHIVLGRRTFLDAYAFAMVRWLKVVNKDMKPWGNLQRFMSAMSTDSGVMGALERERTGD